MKIAVVQSDVVAGDVRATLAAVECWLKQCADVGLVVLPEMFATGFAVGDSRIAEMPDGPILQWMQQTAKRLGAAVAGSVAVDVGDGCRNRHYFVFPDGAYRYYDKRHLFGFGGETQLYQGGNERMVVDYRGVRILLQTCYDLRFPVFSRNRGDYDVVLYVASWPKSRIAAWDALLPARAIENLCYVVACNRVGVAGRVEYDGHSCVIDYIGRTLLGTVSGEAGVAVAEIDLEKLSAFRSKFPALDDADSFEITADR